jgi:hypothetical protein
MTAAVADADACARLTPGVPLGQLPTDEALELFDENWASEMATALLVRFDGEPDGRPHYWS